MSKEIEFKIPMTREEAEKALDRIFQKYPYMLKIKTDRYWNSIDDSSAKNHKIIRVRSTNIVSDEMIRFFDPNGECDVRNWFFYPADKMFDPKVIEQWENLNTENDIYITYKHREVTEQGENNAEYEEKISKEQRKVIFKCFDALGYRYFNKIKRCLTFKPIGSDAFGEIVVDFDNVHDLYYFEIEYVLMDGSVLTTEGAIKALEEIVVEFGLDPNKKDNRLWKDIISAK